MFSRVNQLNVVFVALLFGLLMPRFEEAQFIIVLMAITVALVLSVKKLPLVAVFVVGSFLLGASRGVFICQQLDNYQSFFDNKIELAATVLDDATYGHKRQVEFFADNVEIEGHILPGRVKIMGYGEIDVRRGDRVQVYGKMRRGFGSYQASIYYAEYKVLFRPMNHIEDIRHRFIADSYSVLPEPQASLGLGFLAGFRSLLPEDLEINLSITGLTHIVAVSGYNTTIIAEAVRRLLAKRLSRYTVVALTLTVLGIFLAITGQAPSIVRACIVSGLSLAAWFYGRKFRPSVLLLASAAISAYLTPINYWFSLGWWLSFLAFFGVLILAPLISRRYFKNKQNILTETAIQTTCAQLMTLPLIIWVFNKASVVALLANLLVLPVIPLAMLATFLSGLAQMFVPAVAGIFAWPAKLIMTYITDVIDFLAKVPFALQEIYLTKWGMAFLYMILGFITLSVFLKLKKSATRSNELYLEPQNIQ